MLTRTKDPLGSRRLPGGNARGGIVRRLAHLGLTLALAACLQPALRAQTAVTLSDIGAAPPALGPDDISQLTFGTGNPDGLNYYFDNGSPPGQTFTMGSNPNGYVLTSLALQTAGNSGSLPAAGQAYLLRIYSVAGTNATLLATYTSQNDFLFTDLDWLQFTNLSVALPANGVFAYSFGRAPSGAGWENLANASGNPYPGGEVALIPPTGGGMTLGSSHAFDATFVAGLTVANSILVNPPTIAPAMAVTRGTAATLAALAAGPGPLSYQWQTDGGSGGALTNIPGAAATTLAVDTTGLIPGAYRYDLVVTNSSGAVTSSVATLAVTYESAASLADLGDTVLSGPNDISQFTGGGNGDGLNYYDDNGANHGLWPGQTFTTGTNSQGYYLASVAVQTGGGGSSGTTTLMPYELRIYSVSGSTATLMAHYTNASFSFTFGDWIQWSGFSLVLKSNSTYAYGFGRSASGSGWAALATSPTNSDLYPGGQVCLLPTSGGAMSFGQNGTSDGVFDVGLLPIGVGPSPLPFANPISVNPGRTVATGTSLTLSETATGQTPLHYIWRTDGGSGTLTNVPSNDASNLVVSTTGWAPGAYQYQVVVTNAFGVSTSAVATVTVLYANTTATLTDIGANVASPGVNDLSQLLTGSGSPDGLNYYFDNASPPGQTFTTGNNPGGYTLSSLAIKMAGNSGSIPAAGQEYILRLYTVSGGQAVEYAQFSSATNFVFNSTDWLRWSGFAVPLAPNATYAYTLARVSTGSGWDNLSNITGDPYSGGEVVLIPTEGGPVTTGSSHSFDGTFVVGLSLPGAPAVGPALPSTTNVVYAGTPVLFSAAVSGTGPFTYQWVTDGGNTGGALTNIPGATGPTLTVDTTGLDGLTVLYALVTKSASGTTIGEAAMLTVELASPPMLGPDITPATANRLVGSGVTFTANFVGTLPIAYQWQVDKGSGPTNIPGQVSSVLVLSNLTAANSGVYTLSASNSVGTAGSSGAYLTVSAVPTAPFTVNFQWLSSEGGSVATYNAAGIPGYGSGTTWNQVIGPTAWNPGTYSSTTGQADSGSPDTGFSLTLVTGGSWSWPSTSLVPLLDSAASAYGTQTFVFSNLLNGVYNLVLFSCNGTESSTADTAALFTVNGQTRVATPTQDTSFVESNNYVVFNRVIVPGMTLSGTWGPTGGKNYGSLNGAQLQYLGPAVLLTTHLLSNQQLQLQWPQGVLLEATSLAGPWKTNSAPSPYTLTPTGAQKFYRVIVR